MSILQTTTTVRTASPSVVSEHQNSVDELLTDLFSAYYRARSNKRTTYSQMRFEQHLPENLFSLYEDIVMRRYRLSRSICFIVRDPVQREVFAASFRDRVVHHLLYKWLNPVFEKRFIEDSYSCREGKGTLYGVQRLRWHMASCIAENPGCPVYVLKMDIHGYFMSIDRSKLYGKVIRYVEGAEIFRKDIMDYLLRLVIFNDPTKGCKIKGSLSDWNGLPTSKSLFKAKKGCGLPIGNLTSQLFSNVYLDALDHYVVEQLGFLHYGRYVDDFYIVSAEKERMLRSIQKIKAFLKSELNLDLHKNKIYLQEVHKGVKFLGKWVFPERYVLTFKSSSRLKAHVFESYVEITDPYYRVSILKACNY